MSYLTSENYKTLIYDENSNHSLKITINNKLINNDYVRSFSLKENIFETDYFALGGAAISEICLELDNEALIGIGGFEEVNIDYTLSLSETSEETIPLGKYIVKKVDNNSKLYTKFTLYDYMDKFNIEVDFSSIVPCTRYQLLQYICEKCGVVLKNESIVNGDILVNVYDNSISARTYLSLISERCGGFASITRDGKLEIKSFDEVDTINLPLNKIGEYTTNKQRTISKLIYENATQKFEVGDDSGETIYLDSDSPFSCTQEEVNRIFEVIEGLTYQSLELKVWGDPSIDKGDIIKVNNLISFAQKEWVYGNGFYGKYKTILNDSNKKSNVSKLTNSQKLRRVQSKLNEIDGKIELIVEEVDENSKTVANLKLSLDEIEANVTSSKELIGELEDTINYFSVDLSQYNIVIPVNHNKLPLENKVYNVNFYAYFKGRQVNPVITIGDIENGITIDKDSEKIKFTTSNSNSITNSTYNIEFKYIEKGITYLVTKKLDIVLSTSGKDGAPGEKGNDGISTYFHVKYSKNADGNPMTNAPSNDTEYMGVSSTTSPTPPTSYSAYTWSKIKGDNGSQGIQGADGTSSYFHIKWSENGKHFSTPISYASKNPNDWELGQWGMDGNKQEYPQRIRLKELIEVSSNSVLILNTFNSNYLFVIRTYDSEGNYLNSLGAINNENTITLSDVAFLGVTIMKNTGSSANEGENILNDLINQDLTPLICLQENYSLGTTPSKWQGTYVDDNPTDSDNFDDYTWNDTSIYVQDDLMNLQENINQANTNINNVSTDLKNNYLTGEEVNALQKHNEESLKQLKEEFSSLQLASNEVLIEVGSILSDGVNKIKTATGYTFDENGLDISKDGEEMYNSMNNEGMYVKRDDEEVLGADSSGVRAENITVRNYLTIGKNSRFEDYKSNRTGCFFVGGGS